MLQTELFVFQKHNIIHFEVLQKRRRHFDKGQFQPEYSEIYLFGALGTHVRFQPKISTAADPIYPDNLNDKDEQYRHLVHWPKT